MKTIKVRYEKLSLIIKNVPDWVKYIAIDESGSIYGYNKQPKKHYFFWVCETPNVWFLGYDKFNVCKWEESLRKTKDIEF